MPILPILILEDTSLLLESVVASCVASLKENCLECLVFHLAIEHLRNVFTPNKKTVRYINAQCFFTLKDWFKVHC